MPGIRDLRSKLTYANVMSTLAAFLALAGGTTAIALSGKNSVKKGDIAKSAVRAREIAKGAVLTGEVKNETLLAGDIAAGAIGASELLDGAVGASDIAAGAIGASELLDGAVGTADQADVPVARIEREAMPAPDNSFEVVEFDSDNDGKNAFDPFDMFDLADPDHVAVPIDGVYLIAGRVVWPVEDDQGHREIRILASGVTQPPETRVPSRVDELIIQEATGILNLDAGDEISVAIVQDDEGGESVTASLVTLELVWIAPGV